MIHVLKILEQFADAIVDGDKNFEIRNNDRGFQKGDDVRFIVVDINGKRQRGHAIELNTYRITYVLSGWGLEPGYVVFGIRRVDT